MPELQPCKLRWGHKKVILSGEAAAQEKVANEKATKRKSCFGQPTSHGGGASYWKSPACWCFSVPKKLFACKSAPGAC